MKVKIRVLSVLSSILTVSGTILLVIALLSGGAAILSLTERLQHGSGLLFADVEFFGFIAFICALSGGLTVFGAKNVSKDKQLDAP
jgi:hypothetical protein